MRTIKLLLIFALCAISFGSKAVDYTVSPDTTNCVSQASFEIEGTTFYKGFIKLSASVDSNGMASFTVSTCSGTLPANTTVYLRESTSNSLSAVLQGTSAVNTGTGLSPSSSFQFNYSMSHTSGARYYSVIAYIYSSGVILPICTEVLTITAGESNVNPDFEVVNGILVAYHGVGGNVKIPGNLGITAIGDRVFESNKAINSVVIPEGIIRLGDYVFSDCYWLNSVTIPNTVKIIGNSVFSNCSSLSSISIPNGVISIGWQTFHGSGITTIYIPESVLDLGGSSPSIGYYGFVCDSLSSIQVANSNPNYSSSDGVLYNKNKTTLLCFPNAKNGSNFSIPNTVTRIGHWAFGHGSNIVSIEIPNSVTSIGNNAFWSCNNLTSVKIPNSVTNLEQDALGACSNLSDIIVSWTNPGSVTIASNVFHSTNLAQVTLTVPAGTKSLYQSAPVWQDFGTIIEKGGTQQGNDITAAFTDANFRAAVYAVTGKVAPQPIYNTDVAGITNLNVSYKNISSMAGIEYFTNLTYLSCDTNQINTLDVSKLTNLTWLGCSFNQISTLDVSKLTNLTVFICGSNQISTLDVSKLTNLTDFLCDNNQISTLDVSKLTNVGRLWCDNNQLSTLDVSKLTNLTWLLCYNNNLTSLNVTGLNKLTNLDCRLNYLTSAPTGYNPSITTYYYFNPQKGTPVTGVSLNTSSQSLTVGQTFQLSETVLPSGASNKAVTWSSSNTGIASVNSAGLVTANAAGTATLTVTTADGNKTASCAITVTVPQTNIAAAFTDANFRAAVYEKIGKVDPQPIYASDVAGITSLDVNNKNISSMAGIEYFTNLTWLSCTDNQISTLDVSKLTKLTYLDCYNNQISTLDVSKLTNLTWLSCYNNQISTLDVSRLTNLTQLSCNDNQISTLDVSKLTNLRWLDCENNQISTLDVSKLTNLVALECSNNQISMLDVSKLTNLVYLFCGINQISTLDVSRLTNLTQLSCNDNQISTLDVSKLTNLVSLFCYNNQISTLDVSKLTNLRWLYCENNNLTSLDVTGLNNLTSLFCSYNYLTSPPTGYNRSITTSYQFNPQKTPPPSTAAPTVSTSSPSNMTLNSATLNGTINPNGQSTTYVFQYANNSGLLNSKTVPSPAANIGSGTSDVPVSQTINGLVAGGTYYYRLTASNASGAPISDIASFTVQADIRLFSSISIPSTVTLNQSYSFSVKVLNNSSLDWVGSFYLKDGSTVVADWQNRTIHGIDNIPLSGTYTPTTTGTKTLTLFYQTNGTGPGTEVSPNEYTNPITVTVNAAASVPTITTSSLPNGTRNVAYSQQLAATSSSSVTWDIVSGSLPTGLSMDTNGNITKTPTASGTFTFTVRATNSTGPTTKPFSITINEPATPDIRMEANINGIPSTLTVGQNVSFNAKIKNYNTTTDWEIAFYLKDGEDNVWALGNFVKIQGGDSYTIQTNNMFVVPDKTGSRTWILHYWIKGTQSGDKVKSQGSYSNQVTVTVNPVATTPTQYTITATAGANGTISPSGAVSVSNGGSQRFDFTPNSGYEIDQVKVDGNTVSMNGNSYYTITNVTSNRTINVTFKAKAALSNQYEIQLYSKSNNIPSKGVAADGEAYVEIRVKKLNKNAMDAVRIIFQLLHDFHEGTGTLNYEQSNNPGLNDNSYYSNIYTAPNHFVGTGFSNEQEVKVTVTYANGTTETHIQKIIIIRPPVMLIHGLNSSSAAFEKLEKKLIASGLYDKMQILNVDYEPTNTVSFANNENVVYNNLKILIYRVNTYGYETKQADIIAHSMGGLLTRQYLQSDKYNYNINKVITLNTPHSGSQAANLLMTTNDLLYNISASALGLTGDAIRDLCVDSEAIGKLNGAALNKHTVPSHAIVTTAESIESVITLSGLEVFCNIAMNLLDLCPEEIYREYNDLIVAESSQKGGLGSSYFSLFLGTIHTGSPDNDKVLNRVIELLNTSPDNRSIFTVNGYNPPKLQVWYHRLLDKRSLRASTQSEIQIIDFDDKVYGNNESITVKVKASSNISKMSLLIQDEEDRCYMETRLGNENDFVYQIPSYTTGMKQIIAIGYNIEESQIVVDAKTISVVPNSTLVSIEPLTNDLVIPIGAEYTIKLRGLYSDGMYRNLDYVDGMIFSSKEGNITIKSPNKLIGEYAGTDTLTVSYKDMNATMSIEIIDLNTITGIEDINIEESSTNSVKISIYPNPTNSEFTLDVGNPNNQPLTVVIYNLLGHKVTEKIFTESRTQFNISEYPKGIYIVTVRDENGKSANKKVIKN